MFESPLMRSVFMVGLFGVLVAAGVGIYWVATKPDLPVNIAPKNGSKPGFQDAADESGLKFRMAFLPKEQGEKFKINLYDHGCGVAVADFDGDGFDDIYFVNQLGPNALYRNKGDGTFEEVTKEAGVGLGDRICVGAAWGDIDNDGLPELYVTSTRGGNVLFKNLGRGKFKDITKEAGLTLVAHSQTAVFFDYDNDGFLDLFVTCTAKWTTDDFDKVDRFFPGPALLPDLVKSTIEYNVFYRNNGNGAFTDVTDKAGLKGKGWGGDVAVFDYNEDGRIDLFVTNMFGASQLYRNNPDGTFTDVTRKTLDRTSWGAIGAKAFDFNNDGKLDLLIADMHSDMWMGVPTKQSEVEDLLAMVRDKEKERFNHVTGPSIKIDPKTGVAAEKRMEDLFKLKYDEVYFGNTLFKNLGGGKFDEIGEKAGVETFWPWGIATGDFDNDGYEDVFLPSGMGYPFFYWPNRLLMNKGNETFAERSEQEGIEPPRGGIHQPEKIGGKSAARSSRCAAVADFRNIGRLDIVTNNFNDHPYYLQNQFAQKNWIQFRLQGTKSNRDAIGAVVRIHVGKEVMVRQVHPAGGYLSQSSRSVHFGLGERTKIERVEIQWPRGLRQIIEQPEINKLHKVTEPAK